DRRDAGGGIGARGDLDVAGGGVPALGARGPDGEALRLRHRRERENSGGGEQDLHRESSRIAPCRVPAARGPFSSVRTGGAPAGGSFSSSRSCSLAQRLSTGSSRT